MSFRARSQGGLPPAFHLFLTGRAISLAGSAMTPVALALAILNTTHRPGDLGVILAAQIVPHLALLLVGGAVADRFPRRAVLIVSHLGSGLTQVAVAAVLITGSYNLATVAGLEVVGGALNAFTTPALRGIVNEIVAPTAIQRANSLLVATANATKILGPTAAGLLVAWVGGGWAIAGDGISFLAAVVPLAGLPMGSPTKGAGGQKLLTSIRSGWTAFSSIGWLWPTTACFCVVNLASTGPWQILAPALTQDRYGAVAWGAVLSVRAIGLLGASAITYHVTMCFPLRTGQIIGTLGGAALIAVGLDVPLSWLIVCALLAGVGFAAIGIGWETALQQYVPREVISRVSATTDLLSYLTIPVGQLLTAPAASHWGAGHVTVASGVAFTIAALTPLVVRTVRTLPQPPATPLTHITDTAGRSSPRSASDDQAETLRRPQCRRRRFQKSKL